MAVAGAMTFPVIFFAFFVMNCEKHFALLSFEHSYRPVQQFWLSGVSFMRLTLIMQFLLPRIWIFRESEGESGVLTNFVLEELRIKPTGYWRSCRIVAFGDVRSLVPFLRFLLLYFFAFLFYAFQSSRLSPPS